MRPERFPTFNKVGHQGMRIIRHPLAWKIGLFIGGAVLPAVWHRYVTRAIPTRYLSDAWHLYLVAPGGFAGALVGAWGLKHRSWSFIFGVCLGLVYGGELFFFHAVSLFFGTYGMLAGDYTAGIVFFLFSTAGGLVGAHLAGVRAFVGRDRSMVENAWRLALVVMLVIGFWVGVYCLRQVLLL